MKLDPERNEADMQALIARVRAILADFGLDDADLSRDLARTVWQARTDTAGFGRDLVDGYSSEAVESAERLLELLSRTESPLQNPVVQEMISHEAAQRGIAESTFNQSMEALEAGIGRALAWGKVARKNLGGRPLTREAYFTFAVNECLAGSVEKRRKRAVIVRALMGVVPFPDVPSTESIEQRIRNRETK